MRARRTAVAALVLSAAGLISIIAEEGYTEQAVVPTKNDRPTNGFGGTFNMDGTPVKMGESIKPVPALVRSLYHIGKDEAGLKKCVTGAMTQGEYDVLVDFTYQYGVKATCSSSMVKHINAHMYEKACNSYTLYRFSGGYDCSALVNGKPNKRCWGVWERNLARKDKCLEAGA